MSINELLTEDDNRRLNMTQAIRETCINSLVEGGIPDEKTDKELLVRMLDGMDRAVLAKAKISVDDKGNKSAEESTKLIADILAKHTVKTSGVRTITSDLSTVIEYTDPIEGETEQGVSTLTYDDFTS